MELFLLRHGHAEAEAPKDSLRPLSLQGQMQVANIVRENIGELANIQSMLVSPYLRAQQTAEAVKKALNSSSLAEIPQTTVDWLVPNASPITLIEHLNDLYHQQNMQSLMLITHQPLVGIVLDELCGLEAGRHRMATASLAAIDSEVFAANCCQLRWVRHAYL